MFDLGKIYLFSVYIASLHSADKCDPDVAFIKSRTNGKFSDLRMSSYSREVLDHQLNYLVWSQTIPYLKRETRCEEELCLTCQIFFGKTKHQLMKTYVFLGCKSFLEKEFPSQFKLIE